MIYRRFGKTDLPMPVLSAGAMRSMQSWSDLELGKVEKGEQRRLKDIIGTALDKGINHIETARAYGSSERQLGQVLPCFSRGQYILQTKVAPEADPERFRENVLDSLLRLGVERVDLLALHGVNNYRKLWYSCRPGGCLFQARKLQLEGKVGYVGFSGHGPVDVLLQAVSHAEDGGFDYINLHWYTIFQHNNPVLAAATERDLGIFIISPSDKGGRLYSPPPIIEQFCYPLSPMQFNDMYCLQREGVHTISVGAAAATDYDAHLDALEYIHDYERIRSIYSKWSERMENKCGVPRPDSHWDRFPPFEEIPGFMNISFILWLYNLAIGWDLMEYARARYAMLGNGMEWVQGNNAANVSQHSLKKVAQRSGMEEGDLMEKLFLAHGLLGQGKGCPGS
ncbi:aldo/keto reductase [Desulfogranum japonicum]|uniref:aldo/keto reductase n=1 Tax=Desulfogranum japonicum TaxID=231447 RepID=UPI0003F6E040|nr:aldo/keto reductase [Desulfogranum japonicum]